MFLLRRIYSLGWFGFFLLIRGSSLYMPDLRSLFVALDGHFLAFSCLLSSAPPSSSEPRAGRLTGCECMWCPEREMVPSFCPHLAQRVKGMQLWELRSTVNEEVHLFCLSPPRCQVLGLESGPGDPENALPCSSTTPGMEHGLPSPPALSE